MRQPIKTIYAMYINFRRRAGLFLRGLHRHRKLVIPLKEFRSLQAKPDFVAAVQMARMINAIRSAMRSYLRAASSAKLPNEKDKVDLTFLRCSMMCEAILAFNRISGELKGLNYWRQNETRIRAIQRQTSEVDSFWNIVLKRVRNQIFFHFDSNSVATTLQAINPADDVPFAVGRTSRIRDIVFTLADDAALTYLLKDVGPAGDTVVKFEWLEHQLNVITEEFCAVCTGLTMELLQGHVKLVRGWL